MCRGRIGISAVIVKIKKLVAGLPEAHIICNKIMLSTTMLVEMFCSFPPLLEIKIDIILNEGSPVSVRTRSSLELLHSMHYVEIKKN